MEPHRLWHPCTNGLTLEQHLAQLRFPLTRSYYYARQTQLAACGVSQHQIASGSAVQSLYSDQRTTDATNSFWDAYGPTQPRSPLSLPDSNTIFSAIHLASMAQAESYSTTSCADQYSRWSRYEAICHDMLYAFAADRNLYCVGLDDVATYQHHDCFGKLVWGEAYSWPLEKLFAQYRAFEAQQQWQGQYNFSPTANPVPQPGYNDLQHASQFDPTNIASNTAASYTDYTALPSTPFPPQRPGLTPHQDAGDHCRMPSLLSDSGTTTSSSSSNPSLLTTPSADATFVSWDAMSPPLQGTNSAPLSPFVTIDNNNKRATAGTSNLCNAVKREPEEHVISISSNSSDENSSNDDEMARSSKRRRHRRVASKESVKRTIQNREKSTRYYYRRKAQRVAFTGLLDSLNLAMNPAETERMQSSGQLNRLSTDPSASSVVNVSSQGSAQSQKAPEHLLIDAVTQIASALLSSVTVRSIGAHSNSISNVPPRTKAEMIFLQNLLNIRSNFSASWEELLAADLRIKAPNSTTTTARIKNELPVAGLRRFIQDHSNTPSSSLK